jgi:twitching motility protein PilT
MNRAQDVLDYLSNAGDSAVMILAPKAPPVIRTSAGLDLALRVVMDATDVVDTLRGLQGMAPNPDSLSGADAGAFSFGVRGVGRVRVVHVSQRGSKVLRVSRVSFTIPDAEVICPDPVVRGGLLESLRSAKGGLILVHGPSPMHNALVTYAFLHKINASMRRVIYIIERALTYLMAHEESIVIQSELGTDVKSFAEGIGSALLVEPDLLFLGDVRSDDDLRGFIDVAREGAMTIVSGVTLGDTAVAGRLCPACGAGSPLRVQVTPVEGGPPRVEIR